jgi:hypothetical protein
MPVTVPATEDTTAGASGRDNSFMGLTRKIGKKILNKK